MLNRVRPRSRLAFHRHIKARPDTIRHHDLADNLIKSSEIERRE